MPYGKSNPTGSDAESGEFIGLEQTLRCERRDLILTRSAYDHKRVRPLRPGVGVVKSLELIGSGPVGLLHSQNFGFFQLEKPTW
jgi:hypothetical protein